MLIVKGIYNDNEIKLLEPVNVKGEHIVEIRFVEGNETKNQLLKAFNNAWGIWKDEPMLDGTFEKIKLIGGVK